MAIDTNAKKLAIMEWDEVYEPGIPLSPGAAPFSQGEKQNFLWGYPGILWAALTDRIPWHLFFQNEAE